MILGSDLDVPSAHVFYRVIRAMMAEFQRVVQARRYDWIFTHSCHPDGEYGKHANHIEVLNVVDATVASGELTAGRNRVAYFRYEAIYGPGGRATVAATDASCYVQLTYAELAFKCHWCMCTPDSLAGLAFPCPNTEAFDGCGLFLPENEPGDPSKKLFIPGTKPRLRGS